MSPSATLSCVACAAALLPDDRFCEQCGTRVEVAAVSEEEGCASCGSAAPAFDADGYCTVCGLRRRAPRARSELDLTVAAVVTDQGNVPARNDDAFHLELVDEHVVAIVCDGVSTTDSASLAARVAADAAGEVLGDALRDGAQRLAEATVHAALAARHAVERLPQRNDRALGAPSCTLVSAVARDGVLVIGSVGDSRAYWIAGGRARQLTVDDSWATEQVARGLLSTDEAIADPRAHALTRWVGADAPAEPPQLVTLGVEEPGRLMLCSDGLWNYAPDASSMGRLLDAIPATASALAVARSLSDEAVARGGHDNVTVAVVDVRPPGGD